jgi:signal transduction histidine kinase/ActR/RegA family two-component response regulator
MGLTGSTLDQLDQIGDWGLLATDADLTITRWNRWLEQRSGRAGVEVLGRPLFEVFPDLVSRRMDRYYRQALGGQTVLLSQRLHKYVIPLPAATDPSARGHLQQTSRIVPLVAAGEVCGTITLIEDVTERVAYETELQARVRQQAAVAAVARSALAGRDPADLAAEVAAHLRDTLHADFVEILRRSPDGPAWTPLAASGWPHRPDGSRVHPAVVRHVLSPGHPGTASGLPPDLLAADDHLRAHGVADGLVAPVPGRDSPIGLLGIYSRSPRRFPPGELHFAQALADVMGVAAERKRLEDELHLRVRDLAEEARRKDEFLAMLAHELRNPLAPVRTGLQVLRMKGTANPEVDRLAEMMNRQVAQIVRLVDDLLDVSRITRGTVTLRRERVDLAEVLGQAVEAARPLLDARRHQLSVTLAGEAIHLDADPARLAQVVANLLNNAGKYMDEGGRIWLTARRDGDEAVISVRDAGVGIPADMLPKVFDLFTQIDRTLDRSQGGLGVGLTLVRSLVELHGGTVHATSPGPGQGSEFVVRLPALPVNSEPASVRPAETSPAAPARRILVVDDNVDAADSLATLLDLSGHQVWTAYGGAAALDVADTHRPEVILLDIGLPGMDGHEVARRLRRHPALSDVMLVALTGYGQEADRRRTQDAGFDHHLVKPVDPDDLTRLLVRVKT